MEKVKTFKGCDSIFVKRLNLLMKQTSTKQVQLANYLGVSKNSIIKYKKGEMEPSIEKLQRICKYFNVSSDYMLGLSSFPNVVDERYFEEIEKIIHKTNKYEEEKTKGEIHLIKCFMKMISSIRVFPKEIFSDEFNERINHLDSMLTAYNERDDEKFFDVLKDNFYEFAKKYDAYYKTAIRKYFESKKG